MYPHSPIGNHTRLAAAGSTPLPPVRGAHSAQCAGVVENAVVDLVPGEVVSLLTFVVKSPLPLTITTESALLPNVLNVTIRAMSFRTTLTRVHYRS